MIRLLHFPIEGPVTVRDADQGLESFQALVGGGWIEAFMADDGTWTGFCDEEGKLKGLPVNRRATEFALNAGWQTTDVLCGPVFFVGPPDDDGESLPVPPDLLAIAELFGLIEGDAPSE